MTTATFGVTRAALRPGRFIAKRAASALTVVVRPHRASLLRLLDMPLTVIGIGLIDFGAFHYVHMIGWVATGVSLLLLEHMIADPDDGRP